MCKAKPSIRFGMTLIEILVVISIIAVLAALLMPAINLVRRQANTHVASATIRQLEQSVTIYRDGDALGRFPTEDAVDGAVRFARGNGAPQLLDLLDDNKLLSVSNPVIDDVGRLLDPWAKPYRYRFSVRPAPAAGADTLEAWNWDPAAGHERAWGRKLTAGGIAEGALPFAYLWSVGHGGSLADGSTWIFTPDAASR